MSLGDLIYRGASVWLRLVGNTTTSRKFLRQVGNGSASAAPSWETIALEDLSDVAIGSPLSSGDALIYDGSAWVNDTAGTASALDDLTDVAISSPQDGDVLTYQSGSPTGWVNSASGGGGAWSLVDSWTHSGDVANVDFTGLSGYTAIMVVVRLITASASGFRTLQVSTDNGSTFYTSSGDYKAWPDNGTESDQAGITFHSSATTAARSGVYVIHGFNVSGAPKVCIGRTGFTFLVAASTDALDAIRVASTVNAGNLTGGSIYVWGLS